MYSASLAFECSIVEHWSTRSAMPITVLTARAPVGMNIHIAMLAPHR